MDMDIIVFVNVAFSAALCMAVGAIIVAPRIHEGPIVKVGLIMLCIGLFGVALQIPRLADDPAVRPLLNAFTLGNAGLVVAVGGVAWRVWHQPAAREVMRRVTGWPDLDDRPIDPLA